MRNITQHVVAKRANKRTNIMVGIVLCIGFALIMKYAGISLLQQRLGFTHTTTLGSSMYKASK